MPYKKTIKEEQIISAEHDRIFDQYFVARQPIFNNSGEIWGHDLLFHNGSDKQTAEITNQDMATLCVATSGFTESQKYCDQTKKICINFTEKLILEGTPRGLPPSVTVIGIPGKVKPSGQLIEILIKLKQEGYTITIDDYTGDDNQRKLLEIVDIIKIDISGKTTQKIESIFSGINADKALKLAEKVNNRAALQQLRSLGCDLYQGYFFAKPVNLRGRTLKSIEISKLRILQAIEDPELITETITEIIKADPSITYRLLRLLNSAAFGFSAKIESVKHAISLIGLKRLKYWLRMVLMSDLSGKNNTPELYTMAFNRGQFLEELTQLGQIKSANPESMFLFGILSLVEPMLEMPMRNIMDELPLSDEIKSGYIDGNSIYAKYLQLTIALENADSDEIERLCQQLGVSEKAVAGASNRSIAWTNTIDQHLN